MQSSLLPTPKEILSDEVLELFPNVLKGQYPSVDAYLDVHYTLIREDFVRPIREGIQKFKEQPNVWTGDNCMRVFRGAKFGNVRRISHELGIDVFFRTDECSEEDWENGKRFLQGSLLLFSTDNFESVILGTVLQHNPSLLKNGCLIVQLNEVSHGSLERSQNEYIMIEPDTYFHPYKEVMKVLQSLDESTFPFKSEIVYACADSFQPEYIDDSTSYEINDLEVPIMKLREFLSPTELELNESQFSALNSALTRRLALIQGPPGTGKTSVGVKIAQILLENSRIWNKERKTPMLIVCASNHALDLFLERLLPITENLIRVGDQSKNPRLFKYNLNYLLQEEENDRSNQTSTMRKAYKDMMQSWRKLETCYQEKPRLGKSVTARHEWEEELFFQEAWYHRTVKEFKSTQQTKSLQKLQNALVVGMTTTCAARMNEVLQRLGPPIVIIEEAGEVLEAHIIASLTHHVKHLILIGDHLQLKPIVAHPFLSQCDLDVSLLSKLIKNGAPFSSLNIQYRFHPEISELICPHIYDFIHNDSSTTNRPPINGMKKHLFFMSHSYPEKKHKATHGYSNIFEATYLIALSQYLVTQGYRPSEIVILSAYLQQVNLIKQLQLREKNLLGLQISSIDSFQGKESWIVLLSLVRNNQKGIGFLDTENRICVALSRAQNGLFILGNMDLLASNSPLWKNIQTTLEQRKSLGPGLPINCLQHPVCNVEHLKVVINTQSCPQC